jgi:hypothetical protein
VLASSRALMLVLSEAVLLAACGLGGRIRMTFPRVRSAARAGLGLSVIAAALAGACGNDESNKHPNTGGSAALAGDAGQPNNVGEAGGGAIIGAGGADTGAGGGTTAGSGGLMPGNGTGTVGAPCLGPPDCAAGLSCITATDPRLAGGAPPHGMCSAACQSDQDCPGANAFCYPVSDATGYCVEGCEFGPAPLGSKKCQNRPDFACLPAALANTNQSCTSGADCHAGELCAGGFCAVVFPACLPACRGDNDCAAGLFCDQSFLGGTCVAQKQTGKRLGEPCTVPGVNQPSEPDECLGFCQADGPATNKGHCAATCGLGHPCAFDVGSNKYDGACLSLAQLSGPGAAVGDFGYCSQVCNCSSDCSDASVDCVVPGMLLPAAAFNGSGACLSADPSDTVLDCSGGGGSPGSAGADNGSAGQAAAGGAGGAP